MKDKTIKIDLSKIANTALQEAVFLVRLTLMITET